MFLCCRWIACVAVLCTVVLILAFNMLGLLCGTCGYDKQASPTTRGCLSNTGGNLLMAYVVIATHQQIYIRMSFEATVTIYLSESGIM